MMFIAWRPLAMNFNGPKPQFTTDQTSEQFKEWRTYAESKNQDVREGYQWGYEWLIWLGSEGRFVTFFMNNKSGQRFSRYDLIGAKTGKPQMKKTLTVWWESITDKQENGRTYVYLIPKYRQCNTPFAYVPDMATLEEVIQRFKEGRNPLGDETTETVQEATSAAEDTIER